MIGKKFKMKNVLIIALFFWMVVSSAQTKVEMTPQGFPTIEIEMPNQPIPKLIEQSKEWPPYFTKNVFDIFDLTENSLTIEALYEKDRKSTRLNSSHWE